MKFSEYTYVDSGAVSLATDVCHDVLAAQLGLRWVGSMFEVFQ